MDDLSKKTVCIADNGLFVSFARHIAPAFKKAYYYVPWQVSFPQSRQLVVGDGFDEIERILYPLELADSIDLWIFLDLYQADLQCFLADHGARVWGGRFGEELELHRWEFKQSLKHVGLPVPPAEKIIGLDALRHHLRSVRNKFIKTSLVRGDFETFHHVDYAVSEPRLDELEHSLGPVKENYEFIVEDDIPDAIEVGYDGFSIDGKFPSHAMMAYEVKDVGMIGTVLPYSKLAVPVRDVNEKLSMTLNRYKYRGFISTEIRYARDKKPYLIDPCCRLGTPSNELLQELFGDWPQVLWQGADGVVESPKPLARYGVLAMIHSEWAVDHWLCLHYPKEIEEFVKLRYHCRIDDKNYVAPQAIGIPDVGAVVATGNSLLEAIKLCRERATQIKGQGVEVTLESIDKALETIKKGESLGVRFGDQPLPSAEAVRKALV